jgi:hypothetical protein
MDHQIMRPGWKGIVAFVLNFQSPMMCRKTILIGEFRLAASYVDRILNSQQESSNWRSAANATPIGSATE